MSMKYLDKYPRSNARHLWVLKPQWAVLKLFLKNIPRRPVTVLYPYEKEWVPDNYRGRPQRASSSSTPRMTTATSSRGLRSTWAGAPCADTVQSTAPSTP